MPSGRSTASHCRALTWIQTYTGTIRKDAESLSRGASPFYRCYHWLECGCMGPYPCNVLGPCPCSVLDPCPCGSGFDETPEMRGKFLQEVTVLLLLEFRPASFRRLGSHGIRISLDQHS